MMSNIKACLSHNSDNWKTPTKLFNKFIYCNYIDCFPYCSNLDQYEMQFYDDKLFINPPYSHLRKKKFYKWLINQLENNCVVALLIPSRTDTILFNNLVVSGYLDLVVFIKGRLHFNDSNSAPFPSMLMFLCKDTKIIGNLKPFISLSLEQLLKSNIIPRY